MTRVLPVVLFCVLVPVAAFGQAPSPAPALFPSDARIGFVNFDTVLAKSKAGKDAISKLKAFREKKLFDLGEEQKQADALQTKLDGGSPLDESARADLTRNIEKVRRQIQFDAQSAQEEFDSLQQTAFGDLQKRMLPVVADIAKEHRLVAVFNVTDTVALFIDPRVDLSDEVSRRLDSPSETK